MSEKTLVVDFSFLKGLSLPAHLINSARYNEENKTIVRSQSGPIIEKEKNSEWQA